MSKYEKKKWWERELTWETDRHPTLSYITEHWVYTSLSPQALVTWRALTCFLNPTRWYVSGYPRVFSRGLPDKTGALRQAHRRAIQELTQAGLIKPLRQHTYDLRPLLDFATRLRAHVERLQAQASYDPSAPLEADEVEGFGTPLHETQDQNPAPEPRTASSGE